MLKATKLTLAALFVAGSCGLAAAQTGKRPDSGGVSTDKPANQDTIEHLEAAVEGDCSRAPPARSAPAMQQKNTGMPANAGPNETGTAKDTAGSGTQRDPAKQKQQQQQSSSPHSVGAALRRRADVFARAANGRSRAVTRCGGAPVIYGVLLTGTKFQRKETKRRTAERRVRRIACVERRIARSKPPPVMLRITHRPRLPGRRVAPRRGDRRRRGRGAGFDRPRGRADRRLARKFLQRRGACARPGAHGRALRAAGRRLQDRRIRGTRAATARRRERHRASEIQPRDHAGASRDRGRGAAQARRSAGVASSRPPCTGPASRSRRATASRSRAPASRRATTASPAERVRAAKLVATGRPGTLQIRLFDPATRGEKPGLGACTGDSGAPVFGLDGRPSGHHRGGELVDGSAKLRGLRRPDRRDPADPLSRLGHTIPQKY